MGDRNLLSVVLAGGKSSRMGEDKSLLPFRDYNSLAQYQYERLKTLFDEVYISSKDNKFNFEAPILYDKLSEYTPLVAIYSAIKEFKRDFFLIAVDMPIVSIESIKKLIELYGEDKNSDIYTFKVDGEYQPTASIYRADILPKVEAMLKEKRYRLKSLFENSKVSYIESVESQEFINVNYKSQYYNLLLKYR